MDFFPVLKCVAANHVWRDYNTEQNVLQVLFLYYFADILFFILNIWEVKEMLTKEDLQAIAGLLVPIETRIGNLESRFDKLESRFDKLESRFDNLESRFDNLESRFDSLETRVDNFESETKRRFENLEANLRSVDKHVCELDASVSELQRSVKRTLASCGEHYRLEASGCSRESFQSFTKAGRTTKEMGNAGKTFYFT